MKISQVKFKAGCLCVLYTMVDPKDPNARIEREEKFTRVTHPDLNFKADAFRAELVRFYRLMGVVSDKEVKDFDYDELRHYNDLANKVTITKIKVSGKDASQGVTICGKYTIATGTNVPLQSGHIMYNKMPELEDKVNGLFAEVTSYVGGKSEQPQLPFGEEEPAPATVRTTVAQRRKAEDAKIAADLAKAEDDFQAAKPLIRAQAESEPAQTENPAPSEVLSVPELLEMPRTALLNLATQWNMGGAKHLSDTKLRERLANWHLSAPKTYPLVAPMPQNAGNQPQGRFAQA